MNFLSHNLEIFGQLLKAVVYYLLNGKGGLYNLPSSNHTSTYSSSGRQTQYFEFNNWK